MSVLHEGPNGYRHCLLTVHQHTKISKLNATGKEGVGRDGKFIRT